MSNHFKTLTMFDLLFDLPETEQPTTKCRQCTHSERRTYTSKNIWYCKIEKGSPLDYKTKNGTKYGMLKIKAGQTSCNLFKLEVDRD